VGSKTYPAAARLFRNDEPKGALQLTLSGDDNQQIE
jgi:hypothetical protein